MATQPPGAEVLPIKGDRDAPGQTRIRDIEDRLAQMSLSDQPPNGRFDADLETALRRFQWYLANRPWRLRVAAGGMPETGTIEAYVAPVIGITGAYDQATARELRNWSEAGMRPTTPLVRLDLSRLPHCERAPTYTQLTYPGGAANEVLVNDGFVAGMEALDHAAGQARVRVRINQTFRIQGVPPRGAVVPPATRSQHLIGRAVDGNFIDGTIVTTSAMMNANRQSPAVTAFIDAAKRAGLRWGGDFQRRDTIHFDAPVAADSEDYRMHFFFAQRCYRDQHPMRAA
jgi:hypothetical protein